MMKDQEMMAKEITMTLISILRIPLSIEQSFDLFPSSQHTNSHNGYPIRAVRFKFLTQTQGGAKQSFVSSCRNFLQHFFPHSSPPRLNSQC